MEFPTVVKCFGTFPPKYGTYLISLFGLATGIAGLTGIVLYGLIEKAVTAFIAGPNQTMDSTIKKVVLGTIGLSSLLLTIANTLLFLGATTKSRGALEAGIWIIFGMCCAIIIAFVSFPLSCFFMKTACVIKKISTVLLVFLTIIITVFLEIWVYFMVVASNYLREL